MKDGKIFFELSQAIVCPLCISFVLSLLLCIFFTSNIKDYVLMSLAVAGSSVFLYASIWKER
jgi:hypothetical protein